jgi:hypothetical protein
MVSPIIVIVSRPAHPGQAVFIVVQITPTAINDIAWHTFLIFGSFNLVLLPIIYCFFPETSGLSLEDVDRLFKKGGVSGGVMGAKGGYTVEPGAVALARMGGEAVVEDVRVDDSKVVSS